VAASEGVGGSDLQNRAGSVEGSASASAMDASGAGRVTDAQTEAQTRVSNASDDAHFAAESADPAARAEAERSAVTGTEQSVVSEQKMQAQEAVAVHQPDAVGDAQLKVNEQQNRVDDVRSDPASLGGDRVDQAAYDAQNPDAAAQAKVSASVPKTGVAEVDERADSATNDVITPKKP
jgi:hypothetical protein